MKKHHYTTFGIRFKIEFTHQTNRGLSVMVACFLLSAVNTLKFFFSSDSNILLSATFTGGQIVYQCTGTRQHRLLTTPPPQQ